jgi:hypothetical protein
LDGGGQHLQMGGTHPLQSRSESDARS